MRIPFEGMLAADARTMAPLVVSVWGNDFTLHAPSTALMRHYTQWTMTVADGLHADCHRDIRLARQWGLATSRPPWSRPGPAEFGRMCSTPPRRHPRIQS